MKRSVAVWACAVAVCVSMSSALHAQTPIEGQTGKSAPQGDGKGIEFATADGKPLQMDLFKPANVNNPPVVIRFSSKRETANPLQEKLLAAGYAVVNAAWMPAGSELSFGGYPRDFFACKAAIRHLRGSAEKLGIDPNRIAVIGSGDGATMAALAGVTGEAFGMEGRQGNFLETSSKVRAVVLVDGVTDWRNCELYGDESINDFRAVPYQFFSANIKEVPTLARQASPVNFIRPRVAPVYMIDTNPLIHKAMYATWVESLKRAAVPVEFSEATLKDEFELVKYADPIVAFLDKYVKPEKDSLPELTPQQEVDALIKAGLYKQARRIIDENLWLTGGAGATGTGAGSPRDSWRKLLQQLTDGQAEAMATKLMEAKKSKNYNETARVMWTVKEIVTDPTRLGQFQMQAVSVAHDFDSRATLYRQIDSLNKHIQDGDWKSADSVMKSISDLTAATGNKDDQNLVKAFAVRYAEVKANPKTWPPQAKAVTWASDFGQDLYGHWLEMRVGGVKHRLRYIGAGKFRSGSAKDEWGRQPDEAELKDTEIASGFWLGESEVTQEFYEAVMGAGAVQSFFRAKTLPIDNVSFQHAMAFVSKMGIGGARLPTQEEFEYACRAGSAGAVSGTGRLADMSWFWDESQDAGGRGEGPILPELSTLLGATPRNTHAVKSKLPNAWGLYDMQGNVWEWCQGASSVHGQNWHVAKGGGFNSIPESCRPARAAWFSTEHQSWNIGFRVVVPVQ